MEKEGQAWGFDLMMASTIFTLGIVLFFIYSLNYPKQGEETLDALHFEAEFIAESLLSQGHPTDWTQTNVVAIGLTNENKMNQTKLDTFYAMTSTQQGYDQTKSVLNTNYEFFLNFTQPIQITGVGAIAGIGNNYEGQTYSNLVRITRVTTYNNQPVTMYLYIWE